MSPTTRRVLLWGGGLLVLGLSLALIFLAYCDYRARRPQDVLGQMRVLKPEWRGRLTDQEEGTLLSAKPDRVDIFDTVDVIGVSEVHRVGSQAFYIAKLPIIALILVGLLMIWRARYQPRVSTPSPPSDPLAD